MSGDRYAAWIAEKIGEHAPSSEDRNAMMRLAESTAALSTGAGLVFGMMMPPNLPRRDELRDQALTVLKEWISLLDEGATEQLAEVAKRANLPIDLAERRAAHAQKRRAALDARIASSLSLDARFTDLERAIVENPEDREAYLVLSDFQQSKGDPRGELIALMLASETQPAKADAATKYLRQNRDVLIGPLESKTRKTGVVELRWRRGYIDDADISIKDGEEGTAEVLELLLAHPSGRFLRSLAIGFDGFPGDGSLQGVIGVLAERMVPTLRSLALGNFEFPEECEISWFEVGDLTELWRALPRLARLEVQGSEIVLGEIAHDTLEHLEIRTGGLAAANARALAAANLPALRHLEIWYGSESYGGDASFLDVAPLLERHDLPALRTLALKNCEFTDEICDGIAKSRLLRQLEVLDLSMGTMSDTGVDAIVAHADAFRHLKTIDVSRSWISSEGRAQLRALGPEILDDDQQVGDEGDRYVAVSE